MKSNAFNASQCFSTVKKGEVVLVTVPHNKYAKTNAQILKYYANKKKYNVVYLTVNKPFSTLVELFKEEKVDMSKIFIIDAVTPVVAPKRTGSGVFVGSPKELTNISIATTSALTKLGASKVLFLDSITTLMIHNDGATVTEFIHFISNKMRDLKVTFAILCVRELTDDKTMLELSQFCDRIIRVW